MSTTKFKGEPVQTKGTFPTEGRQLTNLSLVKSDLSTLTSEDLKGKKIVFNIFPSIDTAVCALQLKQFSTQLKDREDLILLFASLDLPFALNRFCAAENIENAIATSDFKDKSLENLGVLMETGTLTGLYARATLILNENLTVIYSELVDDVVNEPNYEEAIKHL